MKASEQNLEYQLLSRFIEETKAFYQQHSIQASEQHYKQFMQDLPPGLQDYFEEKGIEGSRQSSLFRRFVLEQEGISLQQYLAQRFKPHELNCWIELDQHYQKLLLQVS